MYEDDIKHNLSNNIINNSIIKKKIVRNIEASIIVGHLPRLYYYEKKELLWFAVLTHKDRIKLKYQYSAMDTSKKKAVDKLVEKIKENLSNKKR